MTNNPILLSFERWNYTHPTKKGEEGNWNKEKLDLTASLSKKSTSQDSDILSGPIKDTADARSSITDSSSIDALVERMRDDASRGQL